MITVCGLFIMRSALPDLQSGGNEYKDMLSGNDNGITNADTQRDGIANPVEQPAKGNGITNADTQRDGIANTIEQPADGEGEAEVNFSPISSHIPSDM